MKKILFATMMCVAAMSAKAQVITSENVKNAYETVSHQAKSKYAFNADFTDNNITTMYIYWKNYDLRDMLTLTPHLKYDYAYNADGKLTSRLTYRWDATSSKWTLAARHDYDLANDKYSVEYSRYNPVANRFDLPVEKMVYSLLPYDCVDSVSYYCREDSSSQLKLVSQTPITVQPNLLAEK